MKEVSFSEKRNMQLIAKNCGENGFRKYYKK